MNHLKSIIGRNPQVCFTQINSDEIVILNPADENFYHLNESAVDLWLSLETPKTPSELTHLLAEKYTGKHGDYLQDVMEWIEDNRQKGLLAMVEK